MQRRNNKAENPRSISPRGEDQKLWYVCLVADAKKQRRWNTFSLLFHIYIYITSHIQTEYRPTTHSYTCTIRHVRARAHTHTHIHIYKHI